MNQLENIEKHKCRCGSPASYWKISCCSDNNYVCMKYAKRVSPIMLCSLRSIAKYPSCIPKQPQILYVYPPKKEQSSEIIDTDISILYGEVKL